MRNIKVGKIETAIAALNRGKVRKLAQGGFKVSTRSLSGLEGHQWDDFIDSLVHLYAPDVADAIVETLDVLPDEERARVEMELIDETWGSKEAEKN